MVVLSFPLDGILTSVPGSHREPLQSLKGGCYLCAIVGENWLIGPHYYAWPPSLPLDYQRTFLFCSQFLQKGLLECHPRYQKSCRPSWDPGSASSVNVISDELFSGVQ